MKTKLNDAKTLLDICYKLVERTKDKFPREVPHIVISKGDYILLHNYIKTQSPDSLYVNGTMHVEATNLYGAVLHVSGIIDKPMVF